MMLNSSIEEAAYLFNETTTSNPIDGENFCERTTYINGTEIEHITIIQSFVLVPFGSTIIVTIICFLLFGLAIHMNWNDDLTPRASNLPKEVLKNALLYYHHNQKNKTKSKYNKYLDKITSFYPIALIIWSYNLTYEQCLQGIPGTGTRNKGWDGPLLKVNLDGVILLKYHTLLFKVSFLVALLCTFILLPIYISAECDVETFGEGTCYRYCVQQSDFRKTTISNIPRKIYSNDTNTTNDDEAIIDSTSLSTFISNLTLDDVGSSSSLKEKPNKLWVKDQTWRVYGTVICCLLIYIYTFYLLTCEWIENIALRRIYFLEAGHYSQRMQELNKFAVDVSPTNNDNNREDNEEEATNGNSNNPNETTNNANDNREEEKIEEEELPPWKTHPEIRETPPSIGVYSVMFELPKTMVTYNTDGATPIERQLVATTNFFDEIVLPQQGFSSSVVAVTMIPKASLVAKAWTKWVSCESKLQTLRYMRKHMNKLTKQQEDVDEHQRGFDPNESDGTELSSCVPIWFSPHTHRRSNLLSSSLHLYQEEGEEDNNDDEETGNVHSNNDESSIDANAYSGTVHGDPSHDEINCNDNGNATMSLSDEKSVKLILPAEVTSNRNQNCRPKFKYDDFDVMKYAKEKGFCQEVDGMVNFIDGMGIEEFSVFAYQAALLAGGIGFNKKLIDCYSLETLKEEEADMLEALKEANEELIEARANVMADDDDSELQTDRQDIININSQQESIINNQNKDEKEHEIRSSIISQNDDAPSIGIRQRRGFSSHSDNLLPQFHSDWDHAQREAFAMKAIPENEINGGSSPSNTACTGFLKRIWNGMKTVTTPKYYGRKTEDIEAKAFVTNLKRPSYAVVTFTSRHSAIIARQCLADGGAINIWSQVDDIPVYPIADAPALICFPRGCSRPVTPTISYTSKKVRRLIVYIILVLFTCFYSWPVNYITSFILKPEIWIKGLNKFDIEVDEATVAKGMSTISGLSQTLIFSICPTIFKFLADSEGSSSSMQKSEQKAMIFFWYFYIVARFLGNIVITAVKQFLYDGGTAELVITTAISEVGRIAAMTLGPSAISYIIFSGFFTWPALYLLQAPNFGTKIFRLGWINRMLKGGGPGTEVPYRIYVDSGYIFSCLTALAPACPLVGIFGMFYFIAISPMLRWLVVFAYRPRFDGGGDKWPKLHHIIISSLLLGQLITSFTLLLKDNLVEGFIMLLMIIPTLVYNNIILERFLRPYQDAALLQTGRLHYNLTSSSSSLMEREEIRRWLVDCHKASYVPTCLSGGSKSLLTAEPAITTTTDGDLEKEDDNVPTVRNLLQRQKAQKGCIFYRQRFNL